MVSNRLSAQIKQLESNVSGQIALYDFPSQISSIKSSIGNMKNIAESCIANTNQIIRLLNDLNDEVSILQTNDGETDEIQTIKDDLEKIMDTLGDTYIFGGLSYKLDSISSTVDSIESGIDDLKSQIN